MNPLRLPAYLDGLIAAYRAGLVGRNLYLGYWDSPPAATIPCAPGEFAAAQARLTERMTGLIQLRAGNRLLDVACGLGGTLAALQATHSDLALVGLNLAPPPIEPSRDI